MEIFTIGHSNHPLDRFLALLKGCGIEAVADVRTVPKSRKWPHFATDALAESLPAHGIEYYWLQGLGGWRRALPDSPNTGWRHASFRGYADYALTAEFSVALDGLIELASGKRTAIMCSEALWWRCHRRLIADRLVALGWTVLHIGSDGHTSSHEITDFGVVQADKSIVYPDPQLRLEDTRESTYDFT